MTFKRFLGRAKWAELGTLAYLIGTVFFLFHAQRVHDTSSSTDVETDLKNLVARYLVWGLILGGVGQFMMVSTHNSNGIRAKRIDGMGKAVTLLGWSVGLVSGVFLAMNGTTAGVDLIHTMVFFAWVLPVVGWVVAFGYWAIRLKPKEPKPELRESAD